MLRTTARAVAGALTSPQVRLRLRLIEGARHSWWIVLCTHNTQMQAHALVASSLDCAAYVHARIVGPALASVSSSIGGLGVGGEEEEEEVEISEAWESGEADSDDDVGEGMKEGSGSGSDMEGEEDEGPSAVAAGKAARRGVRSSLEMRRLGRG